MCCDHYCLIGCFGFRYKNQNVAIKIIHKGETPEEVAKKEAQFAREVEMLSRVQHKNLAKVRYLYVKDIVFDLSYLICLTMVFSIYCLVYWGL